MKKLALLIAMTAASMGVSAQYAQSMGGTAKQAVYPYQIKDGFTPVAKSTVGGSRWYEHYSIIGELTQSMTNSLMPIWFDSTILQNFTNTGLQPINYLSALQVIDPIYFTLWDDPNSQFVEPNDINVASWNSYSVDSVFFAGAYVKNTLRSANIVDTLIISVSPTGTGTTNWPFYYASVNGGDAWASNYVASNGPDSLLMGYTILEVDSVNRASGVTGRVMWKVPLVDADRQEDSAGFVDIQSWALPVMVGGTPGSVNIPAGKGVAVTITFKSGDTWPPGVDTFSEYHHFSLYEGQALGNSQWMPYYRYQFGDRNMSNLMFSTDTANYYPSMFIEGSNNNVDFRSEYHYIGAHIVCPTCFTLAVNDVNKNTLDHVIAYPNPATEELNVAFNVSASSNATVTLANAVGQVISTQEVKNASGDNKVTFNTAHLTTGIYFYSVEVNGQRSSGRVVIAH